MCLFCACHRFTFRHFLLQGLTFPISISCLQSPENTRLKTLPGPCLCQRKTPKPLLEPGVALPCASRDLR